MTTQLPLDTVSKASCTGAYALFRTSMGYTGPIVNIRRSSDNATQDFYANENGEMRTTGSVRARYIRFQYGNAYGAGRYMHFAGIYVYQHSGGASIVRSTMTVTASDTTGDTSPSYLVDGNENSFWHSLSGEYPWIKLDLGAEYSIYKVELANRRDCCTGRIAGVTMELRDSTDIVIYTSNLIAIKDNSTVYQDWPTNNGYLYYTFWPTMNRIPYGSDTLPYATPVTDMTLESWLGGSTGYITTWYDQSGKGNHATQSTTGNQPTINMTNGFVDFTSGSSFFNLPNGTVPQGRPCVLSGAYISTNSAARNILISDNNMLENFYDSALTATVTMNGTYIGADRSAAYIGSSRTGIINNEFSITYGFFDSVYTKCATLTFRKNGSTIDCYQSNAFYYSGNVTNMIGLPANTTTIIGSGGYGVVYLSIQCNTAYTVTVKHNNINANGGCYLGGGNWYSTNQTNNFRRNTAGYSNYWYANDFNGNYNVYNPGNIVTYSYDGSYSYLYINGTPQGVSQIRSGWNGQPGNECIARNSYASEYLTGELFYLFIFKSYMSTNDRRMIEVSIPAPTKTKPMKLSQLKRAFGITSTTISFSQLRKIAGNSAKISSYDGFKINNGLFMRLYWDVYFNNDTSYFQNNTASVTGVTTNLRNTYCAVGGFSNLTSSNNFLSNESFSGGNNASPVGYITGGNSIIRMANPGDSDFILRQAGNDSYNTQYRFDLTTQLVANATYVMSGWYSKSLDYNGADTMFHARAWSYSGNHIATDIGLFNILETRVVDGLTWYFCYATINTPSDYSNIFHWYMGYGTNNTVGYRYYTKLTVRRRVVYSAEWYGLFYAPTSGTYTFYLSSDESSYFWLDTNALSGFTTANCLINNNYVVGSREKTATISLTGGQYYPFRIQFGGSYFSFSFTPPNGSRTYDGTGYFFCQSSETNIVSNSNLAYHYPFDSTDISGTTLANWGSGKKVFDSTLYNGATILTGNYKLGTSSLELSSASSQYVLAPSFTSTTNGMTISFWYKSNGSGYWARIFDFGNGANVDNIGCSINAASANQLGFFCSYGGSGDNFYITDINYNDNVWRHVVWTLSYAAEGSVSSTWNFYVNGVYNTTTTNYYPRTSVTRTNCYIGRSNWEDAYYNGNIDDFRIYNRVLNTNEILALYSNSNYIMTSGSNSITTQIQGMVKTNPATSGYAIYCSNPWLPNGYYWIKSASMPNPLLMFVDVKRGGFDFYTITGGTSINYITQTHSGIALGLELVIPRSQNHWRAINDFVRNTLNSNYPTWFPAIPIYKTTSGYNYATSGGYYPMFDPRYGNNAPVYGGVVTYRLYWKPNLYPDQYTNGNPSYILDTTYTSATSLIVSSTNPNSYVMFAGTYNYSGSFINASNDWLAVTLVNNANNVVIATVVNSNIAPWTSATLIPGTFVITERTDVSVRFSNGYYQYNSVLDLTVTSNRGNGAPDWRCKDGGLWYIRDDPFVEPSGDYYANANLVVYSEVSYPQWFTSFGSPPFNDGNDNGYTGTNYIVSTNTFGSSLNNIYEYFDGSTFDRAAPSAVYIKNITGTNTNGIYWINLPTVGPTQIYCIMDSTVDGGGWMMAMKATQGTTFNYRSSHWTSVTTLNPSEYNRNNGDAKFNTMNYFPSKDMMALWPDIPFNYGGGTGGNLSLSTYNNWCWLRNNYNSGTRQTLISYFSSGVNVSYGTPKGLERGTAFSSQGGATFYGKNFQAYEAYGAVPIWNFKVRWGFGWNNEGDWYSIDVLGGIGMDLDPTNGTNSSWNGAIPNYSAGDWIGCCQDQTGINRSARVEMYVR